MTRHLRPFAIEVFFSKWEFTARYLLCSSDIESMALNDLVAMAEPADRERWERLWLGYTETYGAPSLRDTIATTYDRIARADVLCFAGAEEGIFAAVHAILGPEDHAVVVLPNYQSAESLPASICDTTGVALDPNRNWDLDLDQLRDAIRPNTRLLYINFPNNPTGKVISRETLAAIVEIARARGIYLLSDEVYRLVERRPELTLPQVADLYERGLSLGVMSKAYGLPGLRIGWIACQDHALLQKMERVKHYTTICSSGPSELLSEIALKARERILARNRALIARNLALLESFFREHSSIFDWYLPDGGCVGYPRYLGADGVEAFTQRLVEESGVLLLPSSIFRSELGPVPTDRFRIGYGRANMQEALGALAAHLQKKKFQRLRGLTLPVLLTRFRKEKDGARQIAGKCFRAVEFLQKRRFPREQVAVGGGELGEGNQGVAGGAGAFGAFVDDEDKRPGDGGVVEVGLAHAAREAPQRLGEAHQHLFDRVPLQVEPHHLHMLPVMKFLRADRAGFKLIE